MDSLDLSQVLDARTIRLGLSARDKDDALHQLSELFYSAGYIDDVEAFVADIYVREAEGVTGIGGYVAIPHGKSASAQNCGIAIATLQEPIAWETLDETGQVDTIFLFCVSADKDFERTHLVLLSRVAARLADDDLLLAVRHATSADEIIRLMTGAGTA